MLVAKPWLEFAMSVRLESFSNGRAVCRELRIGQFAKTADVERGYSDCVQCARQRDGMRNREGDDARYTLCRVAEVIRTYQVSPPM